MRRHGEVNDLDLESPDFEQGPMLRGGAGATDPLRAIDGNVDSNMGVERGKRACPAEITDWSFGG
jgi:hypothetical protein